jgi:hypothetical protein
MLNEAGVLVTLNLAPQASLVNINRPWTNTKRARDLLPLNEQSCDIALARRHGAADRLLCRLAWNICK